MSSDVPSDVPSEGVSVLGLGGDEDGGGVSEAFGTSAEGGLLSAFSSSLGGVSVFEEGGWVGRVFEEGGWVGRVFEDGGWVGRVMGNSSSTRETLCVPEGFIICSILLVSSSRMISASRFRVRISYFLYAFE